ncbi:MAG: DUF4837 family protein [Flavobacteriaceae bacterium]
MKKTLFFLSVLFLFSCETKKQKAFVPDSSGNINHLTVVMKKNAWNGSLGETVRNEIATVYEGLPLDEPRFTIRHLVPEAFTGFGRHGRNIIWFRKDSLNSFQLIQNQFARPQILAIARGEDDEVMAEYIRQNAALLIGTFQENERKEKVRRMKKSLTKDKDLQQKFNIELTYPSAYSTVKDSLNFVWIEKPIQKGSMNLIAYSLPAKAFDKPSLKRVIAIRDSVGKDHIPGRLPNSHMITEAAYLPYFYKTTLAGQTAYLTKGMWEVKKDFMAGPFVNYMVQDSVTKNWIVVEGFAFAPSVSKRDYMFELNSILSTLKFTKGE